MEAMLRIFLYSYLYPKLAKCSLSYYVFLLSPQQNRKTRGQNRFCLEVRVGEYMGWERVGIGESEERGKVVQTMYTHVSKYKNDKIKDFLSFLIFNWENRTFLFDFSAKKEGIGNGGL
jgi:hypothetical protein